jgi:hypothetical protein
VTLGATIETPPLYPTHSAKGLFGLSFFIWYIFKIDL